MRRALARCFHALPFDAGSRRALDETLADGTRRVFGDSC